MRRSQNWRSVVLISFCLLFVGCSMQEIGPSARTSPRIPTATQALTIQSRVTDCEWKAADQYDDGSYSISELARRVMGVCAVELTQAALGFGLSPNDPQIEVDQFRQAVEIVESARRARTKR